LKEYFTQLKRRTLLVLAQIRGEDTGQAIEAIDDALLARMDPKGYDGKDGAEVRMRRGFEEACVLLSQHLARNPKQMTVLEYYTALETLKDQAKKQKKLTAKNR